MFTWPERGVDGEERRVLSQSKQPGHEWIPLLSPFRLGHLVPHAIGVEGDVGACVPVKLRCVREQA